MMTHKSSYGIAILQAALACVTGRLDGGQNHESQKRSSVLYMILSHDDSVIKYETGISTSLHSDRVKNRWHP